MELIKLKIHSIVDVITNSSTVIYTYQNSTEQAKELVAEMLKLAGIDKTPDDVFYYEVFVDPDYYSEHDDCPSDWDYNKFDDIFEKIMKGEIEKPEWFNDAEECYDHYDPSSKLYLLPKEDKYKEFGEKIKSLLSSVSADGGHDG